MTVEPKPPLEILQTRFQIKATLADFSQNEFEAYQQELTNISREKAQSIVTLVMGNKDDQANAILNGATVRAAIQAGFLKGVSVETVGDLAPAAVTLLARAVRAHVKEITEVPFE